MVTLILKDGTALNFNLKNFSREKALRNAWYAMSDMSSHTDTKLKLITDTGEEHIYTVGQIKDCVYQKKMKEPGVPALQKPEHKTFENSVPEASAELENLLNLISNFLVKLYENGPQMYRKNADTFLEGLHRIGIPVDTHDEFLRKAILEVMQAPEERIPFFVSMYGQYWSQNRQ